MANGLGWRTSVQLLTHTPLALLCRWPLSGETSTALVGGSDGYGTSGGSEGIAQSCDSDVNTKFLMDFPGDGTKGFYAEIEYTFSSAATVRTTHILRGGKMGSEFS
jgi:hypothetical protein